MKSIFILPLLLSIFCSKAQITIHPWYGRITNKIDHIQKTGFDSVYSYIHVSGAPGAWDEDVKGVGKIFKLGEAILIGFKNNRISCIKIIAGYDSVFRSKPIDLKPDSMLQHLRANIAGSESELILPYICEIYPDSVSTIKGFSQIEYRLHSPFLSLYFKCATNSNLKEFALESLNEKYDGYPPNLNFKFNSSLKSYKLYSFLTVLLTKYENQFDFGK